MNQIAGIEINPAIPNKIKYIILIPAVKNITVITIRVIIPVPRSGCFITNATGIIAANSGITRVMPLVL
ncbi:MAG: hypothetical protein Tsb006_0560 [Rickettsiaceae bacterium]